jgi:2,4-dienoyl-CoA reductase-like NADH-dependent reductase (Old Yellow Enzyme family)
MSLFEPISFAHGSSAPNGFLLAPLTNQQSHADGTLSNEEYRWLTMRAAGGFGAVMTCASHVAPEGQGFAGQLGCFSDAHLPGLTRLAAGIHEHGALALVQLHHAGRRSPAELIGTSPVAPGEDPDTGARALSTEEVEVLIEQFVAAAVRCERAGFDGVELHGAHDYILCEFLNPELNQRTDRFGGSPAHRRQIFFDILEGVRAATRPTFNVSVRLSPELFGLVTAEILDTFDALAHCGLVDFLDLSLWNVFKEANDPAFAGQPLGALFGARARGATKLAIAGKIYSADDVRRAVDFGVDMVALGRLAITNHDFPRQMAADANALMRPLPVSRAVLADEGLSETFINYMSGWRGFVEEE